MRTRACRCTPSTLLRAMLVNPAAVLTTATRRAPPAFCCPGSRHRANQVAKVRSSRRMALSGMMPRLSTPRALHSTMVARVRSRTAPVSCASVCARSHTFAFSTHTQGAGANERAAADNPRPSHCDRVGFVGEMLNAPCTLLGPVQLPRQTPLTTRSCHHQTRMRTPPILKTRRTSSSASMKRCARACPATRDLRDCVAASALWSRGTASPTPCLSC